MGYCTPKWGTDGRPALGWDGRPYPKIMESLISYVFDCGQIATQLRRNDHITTYFYFNSFTPTITTIIGDETT
ncbi:unnamed protein product [Adineta ricciae]|uniref:Uncharacterized protein n=1 Tax=Adineta ricciae TaxID=249248 RepID=A0A814VMR4_ADIRI|nr:unnamed protein product [Adineta ricciae]